MSSILVKANWLESGIYSERNDRLILRNLHGNFPEREVRRPELLDELGFLKVMLPKEIFCDSLRLFDACVHEIREGKHRISQNWELICSKGGFKERRI